MKKDIYALRPWLSRYDPGVPETIAYPDFPVHHFLADAAIKFPYQTCVQWKDFSLSYLEVYQSSTRLAAYLQTGGLSKGQRVGIILPNVPQFLIAFFAILQAGGVVVAINPQYRDNEIGAIIDDSDVDWLISLEEYKDRIEKVLASHRDWRIICVDINNVDDFKKSLEVKPSIRTIDDHSRYASFTEIMEGFSSHDLKKEILKSDDPAIFQYSGGTTGLPKAAIGLHRNLVANTIQFRSWLKEMKDGEEVVLAALPLYHVYGMVLAMNLGIAMGAKIIMPANPRDLDEVLRLIEDQKVTFFPGVPNIYAAINEHPKAINDDLKLDSIKACISGSAPLPKETKLEFERLTGGKLLEGYGLSEAPTATHCNPMLGQNKTGSIGLPLPDVECRIVDLAKGENQAIGESGELLIKGPQVMLGYHKNPEETRKTIINGWLHTGDIAYMDDEGYFFLVDRKKDLIKIGGFQVWPHEIEEILLKHPDIQDAGIAGILDEAQFEMIKAWVVPKPGKVLEPALILEWCGKYLTGYKVPKEIEFCVQLPRTAIGKLLRRELIREHNEKRNPG